MFGLDIPKMIKTEIKKYKLKGHAKPAALEALDAFQAAVETIEPYLKRIDANDVLSVIKLFDRSGKFSEEERVKFAAGLVDAFKALSAAKELSEQAEDFLES